MTQLPASVNNATGNTSDVYRKTYKIIVIGDSNVGKTCLTYRFCEGKFLSTAEATIGVDFRERIVNVNGEDIKLQLWDTAGQERFRKSMSLPQWMEECDRHNLTSEIPRILVGNKCDCKELQVVKTNTAQKFADHHNMPLFETSARDESECDHVEAIFLTLAHKLKSRKPMMSPTHFSSKSVAPNESLRRADIISITRETSSSNNSNFENGNNCGC